MSPGDPRATPAPRPGYETLPRYAPGDARPCILDVSDNTNLWGMPPAAAEALARFPTPTLTRYPSLYGERLKRAIAELHGVTPDMVVTGHGSDGVIDPAFRAFAADGRAVAYPDPTFVMVRPFAVANGMAPHPVPLGPDYEVDADALLATRAQIIYLCSPNNPTGVEVAADTLSRVAGEAPGLVVVDEAYAEFAGQDALGLARDGERVLVTRTFSKAYGLAGLRIGYGIATPPVIAAIEKARGPYAVGAQAEAAAVAAITEGRDWVAARVADAITARTKLFDALRAMGLEPVPSSANFLFVPLAGAPGVAAGLADRGIAVRAFGGLRQVSPALQRSAGAALRITVGPWDELVPLLHALERIVVGGPSS